MRSKDSPTVTKVIKVERADSDTEENFDPPKMEVIPKIVRIKTVSGVDSSAKGVKITINVKSDRKDDKIKIKRVRVERTHLKESLNSELMIVLQSDDQNLGMRVAAANYLPAKKTPVAKGRKPLPRKNAGNGKLAKLTPELAKIVGRKSMPRTMVMKKIWSIIKNQNLLDPTNRQYAICNDELMTIIGVKRFRTFGMMKYLKQHFL